MPSKIAVEDRFFASSMSTMQTHLRRMGSVWEKTPRGNAMDLVVLTVGRVVVPLMTNFFSPSPMMMMESLSEPI